MENSFFSFKAHNCFCFGCASNLFKSKDGLERDVRQFRADVSNVVPHVLLKQRIGVTVRHTGSCDVTLRHADDDDFARNDNDRFEFFLIDV